ncbi:cAMP-binding domain of CRP or a regulatory subunit of cAMP-dependent protein kinases [Algoriphagus locisalis]|uniref:cAMP-binding domain of CRP or a regulatory subunit of cAMP-dependent protein kinases n=1 Tax=Algoriphagus locisalis TaxID=305507 RepID=A0A1I6XIA5_9BACT|nr:Crp/Fnr family transcriptional regulator [Algoriphagus locisalis]SFT37634.1 cAMP-binding domain of CRP or a regulatory subunit of cAMP-dependent protein kinases [Algoriphagus locisalis]
MTALENNLISYFGVMPEESLQAISSRFHLQSMKKGDCFLKTGTPSRKLSFIKSGLMRIYKQTEDKEVTQWISTPGYFVADLSSLLFDTPARWTIEALTDAELFTISGEDYKSIGNVVPNWHELEKLFIAKCFTFLEDRVFTHLSMTAEERYLHFFEYNKELFNQVPLQYIASMLGMTPETFSRIRNKQLSQSS